jgi:hypothetical protein
MSLFVSDFQNPHSPPAEVVFLFEILHRILKYFVLLHVYSSNLVFVGLPFQIIAFESCELARLPLIGCGRGWNLFGHLGKHTRSRHDDLLTQHLRETKPCGKQLSVCVLRSKEGMERGYEIKGHRKVGG